MKKILNQLFLILKFILFFISLIITLYIMIGMYLRIEKNIINLIFLFIPYLLLFCLFVINHLFKQTGILNNIFYNFTCVLVFFIIILVGFRAILDKNMILNEVMGYGVNFVYFSDFLIFMKILLYGLIVGNLLFMISDRKVETEKVMEIEIL